MGCSKRETSTGSSLESLALFQAPGPATAKSCMWATLRSVVSSCSVTPREGSSWILEVSHFNGTHVNIEFDRGSDHGDFVMLEEERVEEKHSLILNGRQIAFIIHAFFKNQQRSMCMLDPRVTKGTCSRGEICNFKHDISQKG